MSADLQWMVLRKHTAFMMKRKGVRKTFSKEPHNLKSVHSPRYNGLIHRRTLGIEPDPSGKGVVLVTRKGKYQKKPVKMNNKVALKRGSRHSLNTIRKFVTKHRYRKDLKKVALRKASAIFRSQKPIVVKKKAPRKKRLD